MVNYLKTKNCKQKKIKKMTGGTIPNSIILDTPPQPGIIFMDNIFFTKDTNHLSKLPEYFLNILTYLKNNHNAINRIEDENIDTTYVGEIDYDDSRILGKSHIWMQRNFRTEKVCYIIEIKISDHKPVNHVICALKTLSHTKWDLIFKALQRIDENFRISYDLLSEYRLRIHSERKKDDLEKQMNILNNKIMIIDNTITDIKAQLYSKYRNYKWTFYI